MTDPNVLRQGGEKLKRVRLRLGLSAREVERLSLKLAAERQNGDYHISRTWIADVERGRFVPGTFKTVSVSVIYHLPIAQIHEFFGVKPGDIAKERGLFPAPKTHLVMPPAGGVPPAAVPAQPSGPANTFQSTNLLSRLVDIWGDVPVPFLRQLDLRRCLYGYIGMQDRTMVPILWPGSLVQIDATQTHIRNQVIKRGSGPYARPMYFLDIRTGYACGWCETDGGILTLVPHPFSGVKARSFRHPDEAEIVGRVTTIVMRVDEEQQAQIEEAMRRRESQK
jgi:transcriptional regulator with XRE-family HTH domain